MQTSFSPAIPFVRQIRFLFLVSVYLGIFFLSLWFAYQLRFDFEVPLERQINFWKTAAWLIPAKLIVLYFFNQYSSLLTYFSIPDLLRIVAALLLVGTVSLLVVAFAPSEFTPPRSILLADFVFSVAGLSAFRLALRSWKESLDQQRSGSISSGRHKVAIVGAGDVGAQLARELKIRHGMGRIPVAFFDDEPAKKGSHIHQIPVLGPLTGATFSQIPIAFDEAIIAMPNASTKRIGEIVSFLQKKKIPFSTVPSTFQIVTKKVSVSNLRPVEIQDLLGRESVDLETKDIEHTIKQKVVLVTGAGGSIGSELCRQIIQYQPNKLVMVDHCEVQLFPIEQELLEHGYRGIIFARVASVSDPCRMEQIFSRFAPQVIFHAAAHKHVPMMERQPAEALRNNFIGTKTVADLACKHEAEKFILVSTDKAINPTSVMGATKRLAELYITARQHQANTKTRFMAVRFGNVLGSSGSVVPIFKRQIAEGGPVKVTHPEVNRFFMTIPEAVGLILQCGTMSEGGGEVFILDMGKSVKIAELARNMIKLSGLEPEVDIDIEYTGLRPGEKLFEELSHVGEDKAKTTHPKIHCLRDNGASTFNSEEAYEKVNKRIGKATVPELKKLIKTFIPEYTPYIEE
ncbi:MAG: polysaccharide biosynthesis protein [Opitutales bacterium]|nr:polysaccharide biosynthesis protein [Opitutales bacterium]MCH8540953.1 polysaccharide biosynthesis protein [Opitutales bacterium]